MTEDPIDFSKLDPTADPVVFEALVRSITERAADQLAARRARAGVMGQISRWTRPMLAAAAVLALLSIFTLARVRAPDGTMASSVDEPAAPVDLAEAIGIPGQLASWVGDGTTPTTADLFTVLQGDL